MFDLFLTKVTKTASDVDVNEPVLPRRYNYGAVEAEFPSDVQAL